MEVLGVNVGMMSEMATEELTKEELERWIKAINNYSHSEMASLWRFAPTGHPIFDRRLPLYEIFKKRFDEFGGFTPEISKDIGWDKYGN